MIILDRPNQKRLLIAQILEQLARVQSSGSTAEQEHAATSLETLLEFRPLLMEMTNTPPEHKSDYLGIVRLTQTLATTLAQQEHFPKSVQASLRRVARELSQLIVLASSRPYR